MKKEKLTPYVFQLNTETNEHLDELANRSYMSRVGIVRMAIDYLYCNINGLEIPEELQTPLNSLKNGTKSIKVM